MNHKRTEPNLLRANLIGKEKRDKLNPMPPIAPISLMLGFLNFLWTLYHIRMYISQYVSHLSEIQRASFSLFRKKRVKKSCWYVKIGTLV